MSLGQDLLFAALNESGLTAGENASATTNGLESCTASNTTDNTNELRNSLSTSAKNDVIPAPSCVAVSTTALPLIPSSACGQLTSGVSMSTASQKQNTYARVTLGGRTFLIPVKQKNGVLQKIVLPSIKKTVGVGKSLVVPKPTPNIGGTEPVSSSITNTPAVASASMQSTNHTGLNLGSLFVESAVQQAEIGSAFSRPLATSKQEAHITDVVNRSSLVARQSPDITSLNQPLLVSRISSDIAMSNEKLVTSRQPPKLETPRQVNSITPLSNINATHGRCSPLLLPNMEYFQHITKDIISNNSISRQSANVARAVVVNRSSILGKRASPVTVYHSKPAPDKVAKTVAFTTVSPFQSFKPPVQSRPTSPAIRHPKVLPGEDDGMNSEDLPDENTDCNVVDTFSEYKPEKINFGLPHPDCVVETSALSSISLPDVHYRLSLPDQTISMGWLSALQLETITYACQKHTARLPNGERSGFLLGDGAGVGKGRTVAGIIFENYILGRKRALWFSVSNDLKYDSERDLRDIGAKNIKVHTINKFKYGKISSRENSFVKKGVLFVTYSLLISESHTDSKYGSRLKQILQWCGKDFEGVIVFDECHRAKNLVPTGSTKATKTGDAVMELQKKLPNARVIYASATGASEPRNMAYMSRLGLWGPGTQFPNFVDFIQAIERRGVGAMELVAMDLKCRGAYIARQLSFSGVSFSIEEVKLSKDFEKMYNSAVELWNAAREAFQVAADLFGVMYNMKHTMWGQFWAAHQRFFKYLCIAAKVKRASQMARQAVKHGKCVVIGLQSTGEARTLDQLERNGGELDDFVSTARGVFQNLVEQHFPAPDRERITALFGEGFFEPDKKKRNSTKPASATEEKEDDGSSSGSDVDSIDYSDEDIAKIFGGGDSDSEDWFGDSPKKKRKNTSNVSTLSKTEKTEPKSSPKRASAPTIKAIARKPEVNSTAPHALTNIYLQDCEPMVKVQKIKQELLKELELLDLPNNALDDLIDALGGPDNVAEMTGRKGRIVLSDQGEIQYQSRSENEVGAMLNISEKQRFMDGEKNIAIISEAASSGISLQSDRRARNQRRRMHITLELPWSADRAIQQFGRTHRSNQVSAPEYVFLITELAGERRFASVVAKRLESLGALTHGDRRATATRGLSQYNFDNKYGRVALNSVMKSFVSSAMPSVQTPRYPGDFFGDVLQAMIGVGLISRNSSSGVLQVEKEGCSISKFLNRILGLGVAQQNALFQYFSDTLASIVQNAKAKGQYDHGIRDFGSMQGVVECLDRSMFKLNSSGIMSHVELRTVKVDKGMSWKDAKDLYLQGCNATDDGFYISRSEFNGNRTIVLCIENTRSTQLSSPVDGDKRLFVIHKPNTGMQAKKESFGSVTIRYSKIELNEAEEWWKKHFQMSLQTCYHSYWRGSCLNYSDCTVGKRQLTYHILSGSVLAIWKVIEHVLTTSNSSPYRMQIVRFMSRTEGQSVGLLIPKKCVSLLKTYLENSKTPAVKIEPPLLKQPKQDTGRQGVIPDNLVSMAEDVDDDFSPDEFESFVLAPRKHPSL